MEKFTPLSLFVFLLRMNPAETTTQQQQQNYDYRSSDCPSERLDDSNIMDVVSGFVLDSTLLDALKRLDASKRAVNPTVVFLIDRCLTTLQYSGSLVWPSFLIH